MHKIGFVDEDIHEVSRYRRRFRKMGVSIVDFNIIEGLPMEELIDRIYNSEIDLLMVDFLLNERGGLGYNGDSVVREFNKVRPTFPMIIFTSRDMQALPHVDDPNIIYDKSLIGSDDTNSHEKFLTILDRNIKKYRDNIEIKTKKINELINKRKESELTSIEKDELFNMQLELANLDQKNKETPSHLMTDLKLDELSSTIEEAQEVMKKLKQK